MARLNADPEWVARRAEEEADRQAREAEYRRAEAPLLEDLRTAGHMVQSVWDLVNTTRDYPDALPILLRHFERPYPVPVREGIARALGVREARFAWPVVLRFFENESNVRVKDGLAAALAVIADQSVMPALIDVVRDQRYGSSRVLLLRALTRSRDPRAHATIRDLAHDPDLQHEIRVILRRQDRSRRGTAR